MGYEKFIPEKTLWIGNPQDEIESLRREVENLTSQLAVAKSNEQATHEANKVMAKQLAECEAECEEQARLNGMGSEREARLMARLEECERERDAVAQQLAYSEQGKRKASNELATVTAERDEHKLKHEQTVTINERLMSDARCLTEQLATVTKERDELVALIKNDAYAISFQSLGQYRSALIKAALAKAERKEAGEVGTDKTGEAS